MDKHERNKKISISDNCGFGEIEIHNDRIAVEVSNSDNDSRYVYIYEKKSNWLTPSFIIDIPVEDIVSDNDLMKDFITDLSLYENTLVLAMRNSNRVLICEYNQNAWGFVSELSSTNEEFGQSVSIYRNTIVVGAGCTEIGSAYVFEKTNNEWDKSPKAELSAFNGNNLGETHNGFGADVSIHGNKIVVLAHLDKTNYNKWGSIYVFEKPSEGWTDMTETIKLIGSTSNYSWAFEYCESLAMFGETVFMGCSYNYGPYQKYGGIGHVFNLKEHYSQCFDEYNKAGFILNAGTHNDIYSGIIVLGGGSSKTIIDSGAKINYKASNGITLKPGVHIKKGSKVSLCNIDCALLLNELNSIETKSVLVDDKGVTDSASVDMYRTSALVPELFMAAKQAKYEPNILEILVYNDIDRTFDLEVVDYETNNIVVEKQSLTGYYNCVNGIFTLGKTYLVKMKRNGETLASDLVLINY